MKTKTLKLYAVVNKSDYLVGWNSTGHSTGLKAIFDTKEQAEAAITYNRELERLQKIKRNRLYYKAIPITITHKVP